MTKKQKALIILLTPFIIGFLLGFIVRGSFIKKSLLRAERIGSEITSSPTSPRNDDASSVIASEARQSQPQEIIYYRNRLQYAKLFNDDNEEHLKVAKTTGLKTVPKVRTQIDLNNLSLLQDNDYYIVDELRYSVPYLTKSTVNQINTIAKAFADSLQSKGFPKYRLIISSVLRTQEDVNRLRRSGNPNASIDSAHCYGTTFDITYTRYDAEDESEFFMQPFELTKVLGEVLLDQKKAGKILVKYERNEHCFHITNKLN